MAEKHFPIEEGRFNLYIDDCLVAVNQPAPPAFTGRRPVGSRSAAFARSIEKLFPTQRWRSAGMGIHYHEGRWYAYKNQKKQTAWVLFKCGVSRPNPQLLQTF